MCFHYERIAYSLHVHSKFASVMALTFLFVTTLLSFTSMYCRVNEGANVVKPLVPERAINVNELKANI